MKLRELAVFTEGARLARIAAVIFWGLWLLDVCAGAWLHRPEKTDLAGLVVGADFVEFQAAGETLLEGKSETLYDRPAQRARQDRIAGTHRGGYIDFVYPPFVAIPFAALARLPYLAAFAVYTLANLALLAGCLRLSGEPSLGALLVVMSWFPVFAAASYGHFTSLTMLLVAGAFVLWRRGDFFLAGLVFGLTAYKPNLMLGVSLLFLLDGRRAWKALAGEALAVLGLALVSVAAMPAASRAYVHALLHDAPALQAGAGSLFVKEHTIHVLFGVLLPDHPLAVRALTLVSQGAAVAAFIALWRRRPAPEVAFAFAVVLALWLTPYLIVYDLGLLVIPALLMGRARPDLGPTLRDLHVLLWFAPALSVTLLVPLQADHLPRILHVGELAFVVASVASYRAAMRRPALRG